MTDGAGDLARASATWSDSNSMMSSNGDSSSTESSDAEGVGEYLDTKAPKQVTPGTSVLEGQYVNDVGRVEPWTAYYDEYGRLVGRTDYNAGNVAQGIPDTHYHVYDWTTPGAYGQEIMSHMPGEYKP